MSTGGKKPEQGAVTDKTEVSVNELAMIFGLKAERIYQLERDGTLTKSRRGHFFLAEAVQSYIRFLKRSVPSEEDVKLEKARRTSEVQLKAAKAAVAKLEADELRGNMHRSEDVAAMTEDLIYTIRSALNALPGRLAVDVAAAGTPAEASEIIRGEVHKIMRELAEYEYDPAKYDERVRARMSWGKAGEDDE